ncbi:PREDICTED: adhesion G-protein coupled receptor G2-like [Rhinopithecus bieti]|uniref:adhesion G-protein coupled receptor G2-like n=1 Tax=Rhinopithecus bieti TaxID=61621 RepID=UPI00083BCB83|nr:PREDICTED: adhesion G-protein coupled receptor G2-like [Rhinopithecus bieti]
MFSFIWGKYPGVSLPYHRVYVHLSLLVGFPLCVHNTIWLFDTDIVNTSSISDLENQVSQMEKALSFGSLEPNLAGEMINQVSKLLHSPPDMLAPLAQRLLKVVDDIGLQLNFSNKTISLTSPSLALAVIRVNASSFNTTTFVAQDPANLQVRCN